MFSENEEYDSYEGKDSISTDILVHSLPKVIESTDNALHWLRKFMTRYVRIDFAHVFPVGVLKYLGPI